MFSRRNLLKALGLIIIILVIWFASPYWVWLESNMLLTMAVPVLLLAAWEVFKRARAARANNRLSAAVVDQAKADQRPSADVVQLRERFEEAIAMLKQQKKSGGLGLYQLPWYVIIGAPGAGKTTALKYSGLKFPLEQRSGRGALRGVGGTRNCDWWFTQEAVLLDTAGRYTTQDSDASADSAGWAEFLALLKKYRKRRPLNGVLLAISAQDLMTQGQAGREAHVAAARRRLNELNKELRIQLPVYVLVTKCDLIAGFSEYFEDMSQQDRAQVLGVTFPKDVTLKGTAAAEFPGEFDAIVQRLNERVYARLEGEHDGRRRSSIFGFPQQLASLREGLSEFVGEVFETTRFDQRVLLRGVYFTSGTQEGTPIDRLLGALSRRFSVAAEAVAAGARGKAYFIERLMKDVILAESGLAGVSRRLEVQQAVAQLGLYFGMLGAGALLLLLLANSYRRNHEFLEDFERRTETLASTIEPAGSSAIEALPRLDRIRELWDAVDVYRHDVRWTSRGWGLGQADSIQGVIGNLYKEELKAALLATVQFNLERRLQSLLSSGKPLDRYLTLRAYLMLKGTTTRHFDEKEVQRRALAEWEVISHGIETSSASLDRHFAWLLSKPLQESALDKTLVERARNAIPDSATPQLILARVTSQFEESKATNGQPPPPVIQMPAFRTRSGAALGEGLPQIFTREGFQEADALINKAETELRDEGWFWAGRTPPDSRATRNSTWQLYEDEYIEQWDQLLTEMALPSGPELVEFISRLTGDNGGLKTLLQTIDAHTSLRPEIYQESTTGGIGLVESIKREVSSALLKAKGLKDPHGAKITIRFLDIHRVVTRPAGGGQAPIDNVVSNLKPVSAGVSNSTPGRVGGQSSVQSTMTVNEAVRAVKQITDGLSGSGAALAALMDGVGTVAMAQAGQGAATDVYRPFGNFLAECRRVIVGYPFIRSAREVSPDELQELLGPQFTALLRSLEPYIEEKDGRWVSRTLDGRPATSPEVLNKIREIIQIRDGLMDKGEVRFAFDVTVVDRVGRTSDVFISDTLFGGKKFHFTGQSIEAMPTGAVWPAKGDLVVRFGDGSDRTETVSGGMGPWNLFRVLDQASTPMTQETDGTFIVRLTTPAGLGAVLRLAPARTRNPLVLYKSGNLQGFGCDK